MSGRPRMARGPFRAELRRRCRFARRRVRLPVRSLTPPFKISFRESAFPEVRIARVQLRPWSRIRLAASWAGRPVDGHDLAGTPARWGKIQVWGTVLAESEVLAPAAVENPVDGPGASRLGAVELRHQLVTGPAAHGHEVLGTVQAVVDPVHQVRAVQIGRGAVPPGGQ